MRAAGTVAGIVLVAVVGVSAGAVAYVVTTGLSAKPQPGALEARVARAVRSLAVPGAVKSRRNPAASTPDVIAEGLAHYVDHCASCHAADGSGNTEMGRGLFPKAPDMRLAATQDLTDGELFYIIENGVRFTGMPGWSTGTAAGEESSWHLVHFIRHLPQLSAGEIERMDALRPRTPDEFRQQIEEERFLQGGDEPVAPPPATTHEHTGAHP